MKPGNLRARATYNQDRNTNEVPTTKQAYLHDDRIVLTISIKNSLKIHYSSKYSEVFETELINSDSLGRYSRLFVHSIC